MGQRRRTDLLERVVVGHASAFDGVWFQTRPWPNPSPKRPVFPPEAWTERKLLRPRWEDAMTRKRRPEFASNDQTTAGQQESRDTGSIGDSPGPSGGSTRQPAGDAAGRQPYDRSGRKPRDFKRSGQIHSDTQDRTT